MYPSRVVVWPETHPNMDFYHEGSRRRVAPPQRFGEDKADGTDLRDATRMKRKSSQKGAVKRRRCNECDGCLAPNCGVCVYCKDMPKFGGGGTLRQTCKNRQCRAILKEIEEEAQNRNAARDAEREQRNAEREQRDASKQAERQAEREQRDASKQAERQAKREGLIQMRFDRKVAVSGAKEKAAQMAMQLTGGNRERVATARVPTVTLDADLCAGWGSHTEEIKAGAAVEANLSEEGLEGAFYRVNCFSKPDQ